MKALKITSGITAVFLIGLILWVILQSDPLGGEPRFVVQIDHNQLLALRNLPKQTFNEPTLSNSQNPGQTPPPFNQTKRTMSPVPVKALVEFSRYGPLPKISEDGRKPSDVYARPFNLPAKPRPGEPTRIAIVINGLGLSSSSTYSAIHNLPGPITLAFSPYGQNLQRWVKKARELGHEIMLQVPFEPYDYPDNDPGPHTLLTSLPPAENLKRLQWLMARMTGYVGISNAMGAKFSTAEAAITPIMQELNRRGLYYFDNGESPRSIKGQVAGQIGVGFGEAQIILDIAPTKEDIDKKLQKLEQIASEKGIAVGIGTTLPLTIKRIEAWAKTLERKNAILIPISAAIRSAQGS